MGTSYTLFTNKNIPALNSDRAINGVSKVFNAQKQVHVGDIVKIKFAIADVSDKSYNSYVMIEGNSLSFDPPGARIDYVNEILYKLDSNTYYKIICDDVTYNRGVYTINPKEISTCELEYYAAYYTGDEIRPRVLVFDNDKIVPESEYKVIYEDNINLGIAKVILEDNDGGNYIVNASKKFVIKLENFNISYKYQDNYLKGKVLSKDIVDNINYEEDEIGRLEYGSKMIIYLDIRKISNDELTDVKVIKTALTDGYKVGSLFDASLFKKIDNDEPIRMTSTNKPVKIKILVPDELINNNHNIKREYKLVRVHDNKKEYLDMDYKDKYITFETDKFSTYGILYKDSKIVSFNPFTSDFIKVYVTLFVVSLIGFILVLIIKRRDI